MSPLEARLNQAWLRRGPLAVSLWPLAWLMGSLVALRRLAYRKAWLQTCKMPVPVLVVGNRIVGGAGKTPTTIALLEHLKAQGWRPGVLTRGYKADLPNPGQGLLIDAESAKGLTASRTGDEPLLIWRRTGVPIMVNRDRSAAGLALLQAHPEVNILVCDDGLQHLRLQRDIEVIVFDGRGAGNGWLLPAGPLREPINAPPTPGLCAPPLVLYNAPQSSTALPGHLASSGMAPLRTLADWWRGHASRVEPPGLSTQAHGVWAMAGIAHPQRFFDALHAMGLAFTPLALPDHADLTQLPWPASASDVIVTEKD
ncbi:MAG: tetraacyldisaccharide 4'-kinase, partial [Aquabacterium sp.]|nr:tetraacyldisaccharide 4'-kinase [Aquabacterium sp.]